MFDVASSSMIESVKAHEGSIWSLQVHPDGKSLVSGSADKSAKFWNFEVVQEDIPGTKVSRQFFNCTYCSLLNIYSAQLLS